MARINIDVPDKVHQEAKSNAALTGVKLKDYFVEAIKDKNGNTK